LKVTPSTLKRANCVSIGVDRWGDRGAPRSIQRSVPVGMNPPATHREPVTHAVFPVGVSAGFARVLGIETYPMAFGIGGGESGDVERVATVVVDRFVCRNGLQLHRDAPTAESGLGLASFGLGADLTQDVAVCPAQGAREESGLLG